MKRPLLIFVLFALLGLIVFSCLDEKSEVWKIEAVAENKANINISWDPNTEPDLAGYRCYKGDVSVENKDALSYGTMEDNKNNVQFTWKGVEVGTWYLAVTAYDSAGNESDYSIELEVVVEINQPPSPPGGLKLAGIVIISGIALIAILLVFFVIRKETLEE